MDSEAGTIFHFYIVVSHKNECDAEWLVQRHQCDAEWLDQRPIHYFVCVVICPPLLVLTCTHTPHLPCDWLHLVDHLQINALLNTV